MEIHEFCIFKVLQRTRCCAYENVDVISNRCAIQPAPYPAELVGFYGSRESLVSFRLGNNERITEIRSSFL